MPEMNRFARFFVNRSAARRAKGRYRWIREHVPVPEGAACLEIGCGNGEFCARFVAGYRPARYVATDVDPFQLAEANRTLRRRFSGNLPRGVGVEKADMLALPFPERSFDVVLTFVALHHAGPAHRDFARVPLALSQIDRVLRPGGCLIYAEILHKDAIRRWLADHGYSIVEIEHRFRVESVAARKPSASSETAKPVAGPG